MKEKSTSTYDDYTQRNVLLSLSHTALNIMHKNHNCVIIYRVKEVPRKRRDRCTQNMRSFVKYYRINKSI